jgi:ADP-dependent NAD(P)H-hydrate dehydratase / NAD(P)H-hydrate epimerase
MKYVSVAEMIAIEKESDAAGHTYPQMMEHAGRGLAEVVRDAYSHVSPRRIFGLVGSGNNGGDTLVAFDYLQQWGWDTTAYIVRPRPANDPLVDRVTSAGGRILEIEHDPGHQNLIAALKSHPVLLDGILGTGIRLPLRGNIGVVLARVSKTIANLETRPHIIAVDCPSGVDCDTGAAAAECLSADITVTVAAAKHGLLKFPAYKVIGELRLVGIGLPNELAAYDSVQRTVVTQDWVRTVIPSRPLDAHKSTFGVVMVVAGSVNYSGAALLAGESAFRSGAGWVTLAVPEPLLPALAGHFIEATWLPLPHKDGWIAQDAAQVVGDNLERVTTLLLGPGFGMEPTTGNFVGALISTKSQQLPPLVIDADGLKLLANIPNWTDHLPVPAILTPHPGEMAILTGLPVREIQSNRVEIAEKYAAEWGHIVVLKGAFTVIAAPDGRTAIIPVATPALARAGTGDVLAGLIVGLRAQGMEAYNAAAAGAWIHAQAGLRAAEKLGSTASVLAGDVSSAVADVLASLSRFR